MDNSNLRTTTEEPLAGRKEWVGLAVLALACVLYSMDLTVLHLAVPHLSADLKPTSAQLLWIVDIYGFMVAGSLITMGTLGDRIGRRRLLLIGAAAFGITSVLAAFAPTAEALIGARALLGIAGATLAPSTLSLISNMFRNPRQRTAAIGIWVSSFAAGGAIGPLIGGALLEYFWWGSVFLIAAPVMALLLVLGPILLPEFKDLRAGRMDIASALLSLLSLLAVMFGVKQVAQDGLTSLSIGAIIIGLLVGMAFVHRQTRLADPLLDLRLLRIPTFTASLVAYLLAGLVILGTFLFVAQYLQLVLGLSPLKAGLYSLPSTAVFVVATNLMSLVVRGVRPPILMALGFVVSAAGFAMLTQVDAGSSAVFIMFATIVLFVGFAPVVTLGTDLVLGSAPPERAGAASAIAETCGELGGALGIAVIGSIGSAVYRADIRGSIPAGVPAEAADAARDTLGAAVVASEALSGEAGAALLEVARASFIHGLHVVALISAVVALGTAVMVAVVLRDAQPASHGDAEPVAPMEPATVQ